MEKYSIRSKTILGTHHSWAVTMRSLFLALKGQGHELYLNSVNKYANVPEELQSVINRDTDNAQIDLCYTAPLNFKTGLYKGVSIKSRFNPNSKCKMAIYNYETIPLPPQWKDYHKYLDIVLPSSEFSKEVFIEAGWPEEKLKVVPHGIFLEDFENQETIDMHFNDRFYFLNVSINHYRKNLDLLVDAYYHAFSGKDNVCLALKTSMNQPGKNKPFECFVPAEIRKIQQKYLSLGRKKDDFPPIEFIQTRFESMVPLYRSCNALVSASSSEGFGIPMLEALAADLIVVAPRATGQLDFLNDKNSLLADVYKKNVDVRYQYWQNNPNTWTYFPVIEDLAAKMREAYESEVALKNRFKEERERKVKEFTWNNAARKVTEIYENF